MIVKDVSKWERHLKKAFQDMSQNLQGKIKAGNEKGYDFQEFSQDIFSALYQREPKTGDASPGTKWAKAAIDTMLDLQEYKTLRNHGTVDDQMQAGLATTALTKYFAENLPVKETQNPDAIEEQLENLDSWIEDIKNDGGDPSKWEKKRADLAGDLPAAIEDWGKDIPIDEIRRGLRKALTEAKEEAAALDQAAQAFGYGTDPGSDGYVNPQAKLALAQKVQANPKLQEIADLAGRFKREARAVQSNKKHPGPDEITSIETGNSIQRVVPSEVLNLGHPILKTDFLRKYAEGKLIQYKLEAVEKKAKGPVVVCLDNSGSMSGYPEVWSKAIALALCRIAVDQKRPFAIVHFNTEVCRVDTFDDPSKVDPEKLMESCAFFSGGGTTFNPAMSKAMDLIRDGKDRGLKDADIIFITDGEAEPVSADILAAKKDLGAKVYGICIGCDSPVLQGFSDHYTAIRDLQDDKEVKETVFNI